MEEAIHVLKYGEINRFYQLYGFDVIGFRNSRDYIDYRSFMKRRNRLNLLPMNYSCILRDKSLFSVVATSYGFPCIKELGTYLATDNKVIPANIKCFEGGGILYLLRDNSELFFKPNDAECGEGVFCLSYRNNSYFYDDVPIAMDDLQTKLSEKKGNFLIQTRLVQHTEMNRMYAHSVNTLRIVSVYNRSTESVEILHTLLRVGTHGNIVDNWARGGLIIAVDSDGRLGEYGFYKPKFGGKTKAHPDSHIEFSSFIVPYFHKALQMAKAFHRMLPGIHSIGWDVAIAPDGPIFIEGNDNWEISMHQVFAGLKQEFDRLFID